MTLPTSGPLSLTQFAAEYGLAANTPFPGGYYGKPGIPGGGALSFSAMYGKSNVTQTLSWTTQQLNVIGYSGTDQTTITSTVATNFTFTNISGPAIYNTGPASGTNTFISATTPPSGNGETTTVVRVTATNGEYVDITIYRQWGVAP
jgi:hypothetical protein